MVEIGEAQRITEEEHRRVVADDVPVAVFRIEFQGEAADIAFGVRGAALTGDGGEAGQHRRLLADLGKDLGLGVAGDVVRDGEGAVGAGALGVHAALGNHFAVEMRQLFDEPDILQQRWTARTGSLNVEIVRDRRTRRMGQRWTLGIRAHVIAPRFNVDLLWSLASPLFALACSLLATAPNASDTNGSIATGLSPLTEWLGASILWFIRPSLAQASSARERRAWNPAECSRLDWLT